MLALKKNGELILTVREGSHFTIGGMYVSPAKVGWTYEDYALEALEETPVVPSEISVFQAKAVLLEYGLLGIVETFIEGSDDFTKLAWANATVWRRDSPTILTLASTLELTESQLDEMFIRASEITA